MRRIVVDLDGTLTLDQPGTAYADMPPNLAMIARVRAYKAEGYEIAVATARNMRTYAGQLGKINAFTLPVVIAWLQRHGVPYDEIHVGKAWCGTEGFYVDDKAVRPSEFLALSAAEIAAVLARDAA